MKKNNSQNLSKNVQKGVYAPLFDCLSDDPLKSVILDLKGLKDSISNELEMILNTKPTASIKEYDTFKNHITLLQFFGLRDFNLQQASNEKGRRKIAHEIEHIIEKYEPRLKNVQVQLKISSVHKFSAIIEISGDIPFGQVMERTSFPIYINNLLQDKI